MKDERQEASAQKQRIEEAKSYQIGSKAFFSVLSVSAGKYTQLSYPVRQLAEVLEKLKEIIDVWISQSSFRRKNRRLVKFYSVSLLFLDLDTYKIEYLQRFEPREQLRYLLLFCRVEGFVSPSTVVFSGRGLQVKWLLEEPVEPQQLLKWKACQHALATKLLLMGADFGALDPSRVLRVVGTVNSKSGQLVEVLHGDLSAPIRYDFGELAEMLLPRHQRFDDLEDLDAEQALKKPAKASKKPAKSSEKPAKEGKTKAPTAALSKVSRMLPDNAEHHEYTPRTLIANARFWDLRKLIELRGGIQEGQRMSFLFWCLNFFCFIRIVNNRDDLMAEARELVEVIDPCWIFEHQQLSTLLQKSIDHCNGGQVFHNGRAYPPLYTPTNDHLVKLLQITQDEQLELTSIRSSQVAQLLRLRSYSTFNRKRRVTRQEYLDQVIDSHLREKIADLHQKGMSTRNISKIVGVTQQRVCKILNDI